MRNKRKPWKMQTGQGFYFCKKQTHRKSGDGITKTSTIINGIIFSTVRTGSILSGCEISDS